MDNERLEFGADFRLVEGWLRARSVARGLPQPVRDSGGLRLNTGSSIEAQRFVFAAVGENVRSLAARISAPRVFIKVCTSNEELLRVCPHLGKLGNSGSL